MRGGAGRRGWVVLTPAIDEPALQTPPPLYRSTIGIPAWQAPRSCIAPQLPCRRRCRATLSTPRPQRSIGSSRSSGSAKSRHPPAVRHLTLLVTRPPITRPPTRVTQGARSWVMDKKVKPPLWTPCVAGPSDGQQQTFKGDNGQQYPPPNPSLFSLPPAPRPR